MNTYRLPTPHHTATVQRNTGCLNKHSLYEHNATVQRTSTHISLGLCIVWMIRYDTYRDTFDPIHDTYRRYVSDQIYDVTWHIFDKLVCTMLFITSALLRLECTIDCISGSVGHHQNVFPFIF